MQTSMKLCLVTLLSFLTVSLGAPRESPRQDDGFIFPTWPITNFDVGCSPGGCIQTFHMTSAETAMEPGVAADCSVNGDRAEWQECTGLSLGAANGSVWALPAGSSADSSGVSVQHRFVNESMVPARHYNVTGNMSVNLEQTALPANLTLYALSVTESWSWGT